MDPFFDSPDCALLLITKGKTARARTAPPRAPKAGKTTAGNGKLPSLVLADMNQTAARLLGVDRKEAVGRTAEAVLPKGFARALQAAVSRRPIPPRPRKSGSFRYILLQLAQGGYACLFRPDPARTAAPQPDEAALMSIADSLDEIIWIVDVKGRRTLYINHAYERVFGRPRQELAEDSTRWLAYVHPEDRERVRRETFSKNSTRLDITYRTILPDSSIRWVHARTFPVLDQNGDPLRLMGIGEEVTEKVLISQRLEASETRFRGLFSESPASLWEVDLSIVKTRLDALSRDGVTDISRHLRAHAADRGDILSLIRVTDVSRVTLSLFKAENKAQVLTGALKTMTEEGSLALADALAALHDGAPLAESVSPWKTFTGETRDLVMRLTIASGSETTWREVLLSFTDITDLKAKERALSESEEKFRIISEQSQIGLCIVQDNRVIYANRAFSGITGFVEGTAMKRGAPGEMKFNPGEEMMGAMRRMAGAGSQDAIRMADVPITSILGERKWFNVLMKKISIEGKPAGMAALIDITEEKRAREQARERQAQLIQADKLASIGVLAAGVAHEINNPNQAIILSSQVLMDAWADMTQIMDGYREANGDFSLAGVSYSQMREMLANCITAIRDCSTKIETIVSDLKGFARQDMPEAFRPIDLNMAVRSSLTLLSNMLKKSTQKLTVELAPHLPPVMGNYQRLEQVFINLIQNACQALPDSTRGITISTFFEERTTRVVFRVDDEGIGIAPEDMPHITDPFFTTKRESGGTGLGLSICATIVDQHAGSMEHEPRPGGGTRATIRLPAA